MATSIDGRFWPRVRKGDGCWEWMAGLASEGYGRISWNGQACYAHRVSWELHYGPIPDGMCVLHRCDNRLCVRPDHLFLGTRGDNNRDTHSKGRWTYVRPGAGRGRPRTGRPRGAQPKPPAERFWPKVDTQGGDVAPCWEFQGAKDMYGYGTFWMNDLKRKVVAHRVAYALHYGDFDRSLVVMHTCDNPPCCNPHHLRLGTRADNNRDRDRKGRTGMSFGENHATSKISTEDVREMRRLRALGWTQIAIARKFGVKQPQVSRILGGKSRRYE